MTKWWVLIYITLSVVLFSPQLFSGGDNAVYIILAQSLVSGHGYRDLHLVGEPVHRTYPPGFPLSLCPFIALFDYNLIVLKVVMVLWGLAAVLIFDKITRLLLPPPFGSLAMIAFLLTPALYTYSHSVLSDVPYMTLSLGAIYFMVRK